MDEEQIKLALTNTPNLLSKRLTPQRDELKLTRGPRKDEWSAKEIVAHLRDTEARIFPKLYLIAVEDDPQLRRVEDLPPTDSWRPDDSTLVVMAQFRRLRQSTLSLLRELPSVAWNRSGRERDGRSVKLRDLAEYLVHHDAEHLDELDRVLLARNAMPPNVVPRVPAGV
jgi:hypothetical protein